MEKTRDLLRALKVPNASDTYTQVVAADIKNVSHAWNFENNQGNILDLIDARASALQAMWVKNGKKYAGLNMTAFNQHLCFIGHYCTDCFTIGQLSSKFWGSIDNRIDMACEAVYDKKAYPATMNSFASYQVARASLLVAMRGVYDTYKKQAPSWTFLISGNLRTMCRNAVKGGAEYTAAYVKIALS